jgi:ankyrin repeat protein
MPKPKKGSSSLELNKKIAKKARKADNKEEIEDLRIELETYLHNISFGIDRAEIRNQILEFIVNYNLNLIEDVPYINTPLIFWALQNSNSLEFIDILLELYSEQNYDLNDITFENDMSLVQYSMDNNLQLKAQLLVNHGVNPNYVNKNGKAGFVKGRSLDEITSFSQGFFEVIHKGNVRAVVDEFLQNNAIDTPLDGFDSTLLHLAISSRVIKPDLKYIVEQYLKFPKGIEVTDLYGATPLIIAIQSYDLSAVQLLLKNHANVKHKDTNSKSVLEYAMEGKRDVIFKLIFEAAPEADKTREMRNRYARIKPSSNAPILMSNNLSRNRNATTGPTSAQIKQFTTANKKYKISSIPSKPMFTNQISKEHAEHWIRSHPARLQPLALKLIDNITHVSFADFQTQLATCAQSLKLPKDYILVLPETEDKSNPWVFSYAMANLSHLPTKILWPSEIPEYIQEQDQTRYDLLFVDDAAFSGTQTKIELVDAATQCFDKDTEVNVHYLIPYMTKRAHELLQRHHDAQFGLFKSIQGINKKFTDDEKRILQENNVNSTDEDVRHHLNWPELTLTYFEHKIADWKSAFPGIMREGRTIDDINARLPFIPVTVEPYKKNLSLPAHVVEGMLKNQYELGLPKLSTISPALNTLKKPPKI